MSLTKRRAALHLAAVALIAVVAMMLAYNAFAASSPFGVATPDSSGSAFGGPLGPIFQWVALRQAEFYRTLTGTLSEMKENGWAAWLLLAVSFTYGVFHAAGPGHGKAVISAYVLSSGESLRRGVLISFASAFVQALSAITIVLIGSIALRVTARSMTVATEWIEIASYALIAGVGAWLLFAKITGRGHHHHHHSHDAHAAHHDHAHGDHDHHDHPHAHAHHDDHRHHTSPARSLAAAWSAILAVGIRPCSGAIIILVFALTQGLFLAGVAATFVMAIGTGLTVAVLATLAVSARGLAVRLTGSESSMALGAIKAVEIVAALAILLFGLLMLGGAIAGGLPG
jgi:nickel/cobalt exporter